MKLISIIVPVYNVAFYLPKCLDSIIAQTYSNIEILLINDGSTDESGKICDEYAQKDPRIKVWHKENGGVSSARNLGIEMACGQYIGFVDSDDIIEPEMFENLLTNAVLHQCEISCCTLNTVKRDGSSYCLKASSAFSEESKNVITKYFTDPFVKALLYGPNNKIFRADIIHNIRFRPYRLGEDILFVFEALIHCTQIYFDTFVGYHYMMRENSAMTSPFSIKRLDYIAAARTLEMICETEAPYAATKARIWVYGHVLITIRQIYANRKQHHTVFANFIRENLPYLRENRALLSHLPFKRQIDYYLLNHMPFIYRFIQKGGR